jgi:hypothetical protein
MHQIPSVEQFLVVFQAVVCVGLAARIWKADLIRTYPYFFCFLIVHVLQSAFPFVIPFMTNLYRNIFVASEVLALVFYVLMVQEVFGSVLRGLKGLATVSRRFIRGSVIAAILVSALLLFAGKAPVTVTGCLFLFDQGIMSTLLLFVLLISCFLVYYPVSLKRNVFVYSIGYAFYFLAKTGTLFIRNTGPQQSGVQPGRLMSTFLLAVSVSSLAFWFFGISRKGEQVRNVIGHRWNPDDEERLLRQLHTINEKILHPTGKASRKD